MKIAAGDEQLEWLQEQTRANETVLMEAIEKMQTSIETVRESLSDAEVKRAFKAAAKRLHPDLFQAPGEKASAETAFKNLLTAYEALKGAEGRQRYQRRPARR